MPTKWFFPSNNGGEESGLNDAGIQFFRSSGALARETIQNSGDAAHGSGGPVRVTFELTRLPITKFPDVAELRDTISRCADYMLQACRTEEQRKQNGQEFFEKANSLLAEPTIPVLRIGDYGTTGLEGGDDEPMTPWYRLIRKQGTSSMHGAGGGTYGIGQRAPFAFSALRTVYYSTITRNGDWGLIGKSILCSFTGSDGDVRRPVGYWGLTRAGAPGVQRVSNPEMIPASFRRDMVGTDLHILGYMQEDWREEVAHSVLSNFFAAIHAGRLVVELRDEAGQPLTITSENVGSLLEDEHARAVAGAESASEREEIGATLGVTRHYVRALESPNAGAPFTGSIRGLGEVKLYLTLADDAPQRVAFMRKPRILVFDRRQKLLKGYAAVFVCETDDGNRLLAQLEDPSHQQWDRSRMKGGDRIIRDINAFVRESLQKVISADQGEAQDIPDLWRFLPEEADESRAKGRGKNSRAGDPRPEETADPVPRKKKLSVVKNRLLAPPEPSTPHSGSLGPGDGSEEGVQALSGGVGGQTGDGGGESGGEPGVSQGEPGQPGAKLPTLRASDLRFRAFFDKDRGCVRLVLSSTRRGVGDIALTAVGEDSDYDVTVQSARDEETGAEIPVSGGMVRELILQKAQPRRLLLTLRGDQHVALSAEVRHGR